MTIDAEPNEFHAEARAAQQPCCPRCGEPITGPANSVVICPMCGSAAPIGNLSPPFTAANEELSAAERVALWLIAAAFCGIGLAGAVIAVTARRGPLL